MLQISSYFTDKLLGIVRDTIFHMKELNRSENEQNVYVGRLQLDVDVNKGDAALEFIKHVCAVLALDQNVQHDVLVIFVSLFSCHCLSLLSFDFVVNFSIICSTLRLPCDAHYLKYHTTAFYMFILVSEVMVSFPEPNSAGNEKESVKICACKGVCS